MATVGLVGSSIQANSQPNCRHGPGVGQQLKQVCIHRINRVNSCNDLAMTTALYYYYELSRCYVMSRLMYQRFVLA